MTMIWCCQSLRSTIGSPGDLCDWRHIPGAPPGSTPLGMPQEALPPGLRHPKRALFGSPLPRERLFGDVSERRDRNVQRKSRCFGPAARRVEPTNGNLRCGFRESSNWPSRQITKSAP